MATAEHSKGRRASGELLEEDLHEGLDDADIEHLDDDDVPIPRETGPVPKAAHHSFMRAARGGPKEESAMLPGASLPREGGLIAGKYRVDGVHDRDSMVVTLKATHVELGKPVWVRYLLPRAVRRHDAIARFISAARTVAKMRSEHAARVLDVGRIRSGIPFVVIDDMNGWDLDEVLRVRGPLPVQEAVEYVLQAADAIAEAHAMGVVHGSLRPSNVLLARRDDDSPLVKVVGFELSDVIDWTSATGGGDGAPSPSWFAATLPYLAPEQIRSADHVDERVDVWALGAILQALLCGAPPFRGRTPAALLASVAADDPRPIGEVRGDVAEELEELIFRCLSKNPADRPANVAEIAQTLTPFAPGDGLSLIDRISRMPSSTMRPPPLMSSVAPPPRSFTPSTRAIVPVPRARIVKKKKEEEKPVSNAPSAQWLLMTALVGLGTSVLGATAVILVANSSRGVRDDSALMQPQEPRAAQAAPEQPAPGMAPGAPAKAAELPAATRAPQPAERAAATQAAEGAARQVPPATRTVDARPARAASQDAVARSDGRSSRTAGQGTSSETAAKSANDLFNDTR
ncbi:MAG TPA: serine/threonine-protein kinase [Polyangiaceae bacterium]|nr:serine/threonine-protein kinase [Polyangiaceae bacterium]